MGIWVNNLTKAPYLLLFALLFVGVGAASAAGIILSQDTVVQGTMTADNYFDTSNTQTGTDASALGGIDNTASGVQSTVGGGDRNDASGERSTVGGGFSNTASGDFATVGGGINIIASGFGSTVGGGQANTASFTYATVGGGLSNTASGVRSTVGGGQNNQATASDSTVGGGLSNSASGSASTIGGGGGNIAQGLFPTIPGGDSNLATGDYSFAAGRRAHATHDGAFVWADSTDANFLSTAPDEFSIRAAGGVRVVGDITCTSCFEVTLERLGIIVPPTGTINAVLDCPNPTAAVTGFYIDDLNFNSPADIRTGSGITPDGNTLTLMLVTEGSSQDTVNIHFICLSI